MATPESIDWFAEFARRRAASLSRYLASRCGSQSENAGT